MKKNLLLCFDAFGTLFVPKRLVHEQYVEVARRHGLTGLKSADVARSFEKAFAKERKANPNYGRATGMGATKWWTNVINNTFGACIKQDQTIPSALAADLLTRFSSDEGYKVFDDARGLLKDLSESDMKSRLETFKDQKAKPSKPRVIVGIITNSDDRVINILTSLSFKVSALRHGSDFNQAFALDLHNDIDFSIISYDVGHEKPDRPIFQAATDMLVRILKAEGQPDPNMAEWDKVLVGDNFEKDIMGALNADWSAIYMVRGESVPYSTQSSTSPDIRSAGQLQKHTLEDGRSYVSVSKLTDILQLLT